MKRLTIPILSPEPAVIKCRHCGSTQVRPSHRSSGEGARVTYRCQSCKRHFRVGSGPSRTRVFAGAALASLVLIGLATALLKDDAAEEGFSPRVGAAVGGALVKVQQDASRGNPQAQYDLGWTYWQNAEYPKALPWLQAAADHGHVEAEYLLGMAYLNGRGTVQNFRLALEHFTTAAHESHLEAQYRLGIFYRDGLATPPNKESAYLWLNVAAARGHEEATQYRDKLATAMSAEEINRAQEASAAAITNLSSPATGKP